MKSLVEIMREKNGSDSNEVTTRAQMGVATAAILGSALGESKATKFANQAANLVTSTDFLNELEQEVGRPKSDETEDEFVARAKAGMYEMLRGKLK